MARKMDFTIERPDGSVERAVVGIDGQVHHPPVAGNNRGRDGHFTDEGEYRRAIERAVKENGG